MKPGVRDLLKQNHLSITDSRIKILHLFIGNGSALSHADIEKFTGEAFDRVTVYRTLQIFVERGIIHVIPTTDNSTKYALCKNDSARVTIMIIKYIFFAMNAVNLFAWKASIYLT